MILEAVLFTTIFVVLNGMFVAAEFALVAAPRVTLEARAGRGDRTAAGLLATLSSPQRQDRYMATSQLGITAASLGLGMYGEHTVATILEPYLGGLPLASAGALAGAIALVTLTFLHIVIGEMVPKGFALHRPARVARLAYWPMKAALAVLYPFAAVLGWLADGCLRLAGIHRQVATREQSYTPDELRLIVEESAEGGALGADSGLMLRELFDFGDLTAGQAMVPRVRVAGIPVGASPADVRRIVGGRRHTRYPVYDGDLDHIVGMLHAKDLLRRLILDERISAADVRPIPVVPETSILDDVLTTMQRAHAHLAVVVDEHGGTAGIISIEDLIEEVVGEIDEGPAAAPSLAAGRDGSVRAAGTVRLDELGQHFNIDLRHDEVDSLSGLVLAVLDRPPVVGDVVEYGRVRLEVTATTGRGVAEVRATLLPGEG